MRALVGDPPLANWENPTGAPLYPEVPADSYERVLDFGCGCGRMARRLLQMRRPPSQYLGVDLHPGMVEWCRQNLAPAHPGFEFVYHAVYSAGLSPDPTLPAAAPLPAEAEAFTLIEATSVFTHLVEPQAEYYLDEVRRVIAPDGWFASSWFLFERNAFPMLQDFQNALYINELDLSNAVIFDRTWLVEALSRRGLIVAAAVPPRTRGYHWQLFVTPERPGIERVELPRDSAPIGSHPPPARTMQPADRLAQFDGLQAPARELAEAKRRIAELEARLHPGEENPR